MTWHIGASTAFCTDRALDPALDALAAAGIRAIEIDTPRRFDPWSRDHVRAVQARLAARGLTAISTHAPCGGALDLSDPNYHHRSAALGAILNAALVLRDLGGRIVVVHPSNVPRGADAASRLSHSADSLQRLQDACDAEDMTLAIETPLPHVVGGAPDEFAWLIDRVGRNARVCIDTAHLTLGHNWNTFIRAVGHRVVHVHATDHFGREDDHLPPGDGVTNWMRIGASLRDLHYDGWLMLDVRCPTEPVDAYFRQAAEGLARELDGICTRHANVI